MNVTLHPFQTKFPSFEEVTAYLVNGNLPESDVIIVAESCPSCEVTHVYKFINEPFKQEVDKDNDEIINSYHCRCASCGESFTAKVEFDF